jgi:hypothetical protein
LPVAKRTTGLLLIVAAALAAVALAARAAQEEGEERRKERWRRPMCLASAFALREREEATIERQQGARRDRSGVAGKATRGREEQEEVRSSSSVVDARAGRGM